MANKIEPYFLLKDDNKTEKRKTLMDIQYFSKND